MILRQKNDKVLVLILIKTNEENAMVFSLYIMLLQLSRHFITLLPPFLTYVCVCACVHVYREHFYHLYIYGILNCIFSFVYSLFYSQPRSVRYGTLWQRSGILVPVYSNIYIYVYIYIVKLVWSSGNLNMKQKTSQAQKNIRINCNKVSQM